MFVKTNPQTSNHRNRFRHGNKHADGANGHSATIDPEPPQVAHIAGQRPCSAKNFEAGSRAEPLWFLGVLTAVCDGRRVEATHRAGLSASRVGCGGAALIPRRAFGYVRPWPRRVRRLAVRATARFEPPRDPAARPPALREPQPHAHPHAGPPVGKLQRFLRSRLHGLGVRKTLLCIGARDDSAARRPPLSGDATPQRSHLDP